MRDAPELKDAPTGAERSGRRVRCERRTPTAPGWGSERRRPAPPDQSPSGRLLIVAELPIAAAVMLTSPTMSVIVMFAVAPV